MKKYAINVLTDNPYTPSGAQAYYYHVIEEMGKLLEEEERLYVFCSRANYTYFKQLFINKKIRPVIFPFSNEKQLFRILTEHFLFPYIIRKYKIDVYNCGNLAPLYIPSKCKIVATIKTMHAFTNPSAFSFIKRNYRVSLGKRTAIKAALIISNSNSNTQDILKYLKLPSKKIRLVYEAVEHGIFKPLKNSIQINKYLKENYNIEKPFILFVSSFYKYKNAEILIKSFAELKLMDKYQLVFVGFPREKEYFNEIQKLVLTLGINESVVFTGGVRQEETAKFYQTAELFVYPSKYETFGLTILEAMACNCPVITSKISSMPEIGGEAALYFNPRSTEDLSEKISKVLNSKETRERMINKGLKRASEFSWEKTATKTLKVYREVLSMEKS